MVKAQVIEDLSQELNLGAKWLQQNNLSLHFSPTGARVEKLIGGTVPLVSTIMEKDETPAGRPEEIAVCTVEEVKIPSYAVRWVAVSVPEEGQSQETAAHIVPVDPAPQLGCRVLEGIYPLKEGRSAVLLANGSSETIHIPMGERIGTNTGPVSIAEIQEGKVSEAQDIWEQLKLEDNEILAADPEAFNEVRTMIREYVDVFSVPAASIGCTDKATFRVELKPGTQPVRQKVRPLNPDQRKSLQEQLKVWTDEGVIERTSSPWASPLVPVMKKTGDIRWAVDYRALNGATVADTYPLPSIAESLERLSGAEIFSCLDAASAYNVIPVEEESREKLAFISPFGCYTYKRMPFGAKNSGACYARFIGRCLEELGSPYLIAYLDDLLIFTKRLPAHLQTLRQVLQMHRDAGIKIKASKTKLFQSKITYLGHRVSKEGIEMEPS